MWLGCWSHDQYLTLPPFWRFDLMLWVNIAHKIPYKVPFTSNGRVSCASIYKYTWVVRSICARISPIITVSRGRRVNFRELPCYKTGCVSRVDNHMVAKQTNRALRHLFDLACLGAILTQQCLSSYIFACMNKNGIAWLSFFDAVNEYLYWIYHSLAAVYVSQTVHFDRKTGKMNVSL